MATELESSSEELPAKYGGEQSGFLPREKRRSGSSSDESSEDDDLQAIMADPKRKKQEIRKIWKNLILVCIAFVGNFTAFNGASALQSSLNADDGLGTGSLSIIYGTLIISAMFLPTYVINFLGCKWTMVVAICCYCTYPLANFYPHWGTLVPSSIFVGLGAAPLWSAKCTYLTTAAKRYGILTGETTDVVVNRFFGIFFLFFQSTQIIGNLISSFVLSSGVDSLEFPTCYNATYIENYCGKNDCQEDLTAARLMYNSTECPVNELNAAGPSNSTIYTLMGIYTAIGFTGALVLAVAVDKIKIRQHEDRGPFDLLVATFKHMKDRRQLLLIPITMYSGFEQSFLTGEYTRSYVTCPLGVNWVGFVIICYGACDAVCSLLAGGVEKWVGRLPLFTLAALINLGLIITFQIWIPYPDMGPLFFILAGLWGVADAVWQTQLNAYYGVLFVTNQEASFANYRLWESLGFVIAFAYQSFICLEAKIWVLLAVLVVGMLLYYYVEFKERKKLSRSRKVREGLEKENEAYLESTKSGLNNKNRITSM